MQGPSGGLAMTHERQRFDDEHNHDIHDPDAAVDDPGFLEDQLLAFHYSYGRWCPPVMWFRWLTNTIGIVARYINHKPY